MCVFAMQVSCSRGLRQRQADNGCNDCGWQRRSRLIHFLPGTYKQFIGRKDGLWQGSTQLA